MCPPYLNKNRQKRWRGLQWMLVALFVLCSGAAGAAQEITTGVTYVCNGDRWMIDGCNMRDTSDVGKCYIGHPDHVSPGGIMAYTYVTRGELKKILPTCTPPSPEILARARAQHKKAQDMEDAAQQKNMGVTRSGGSGGGLADPMMPDPAEYRECMESGREPGRCSGQSTTKGITGLLGVLVPQAKGFEENIHRSGLFLTGTYKGAGTFKVSFGEDGASIVCKDFEPEGHRYHVEINGNRAVVRVEAEPRPILLSVKPDGTLMGPGDIDLKGNVVVRYEQVRDRDPKTGADLYSTHPVPITEPRVERCNIGAITGKSSGSQEELGSAIGFLDPSPIKDVPAGLRLDGEYGGAGGFGLKFYVDSALVRCGDISVAHEYSFQQRDNDFVVVLKDPARALVFSYRADGTLVGQVGSGPVRVNGRKTVGKQANGDPVYAPRSTSCMMGVVSPVKAGSSTAASRAAANASAVAAAPATSGSGAAIATPTAPTGSATLSILSGFAPEAGAANPLAGRPYMLLRKRYGDVVAKAGIAVPAGMSPYKYMATACASGTPECQKILEAVKAEVASSVHADANGNGIFPGVAPGNYYLMISARYKNNGIVWEQPVQLKPGANSLKLDLSNATPLN
jgi:hypothetical protein